MRVSWKPPQGKRQLERLLRPAENFIKAPVTIAAALRKDNTGTKQKNFDKREKLSGFWSPLASSYDSLIPIIIREGSH